jgi:hypothetical protein
MGLDIERTEASTDSGCLCGRCSKERQARFLAQHEALKQELEETKARLADALRRLDEATPGASMEWRRASALMR